MRHTPRLISVLRGARQQGLRVCSVKGFVGSALLAIISLGCGLPAFAGIQSAYAGIQSVFAGIQYSEVSGARNLRHTPLYGETFDGLEEVLAMMQRNMGNGVAAGDYDGDGDLDLYLLSQMGAPNVLLRNNLELGIKSFTDVTEEAGVGHLGLSRAAHFADLDNDGLLDLIVVNDDDGSGLYPSSRVYRNDGGGVFTDVSATAGFSPFGYLRCGMSLADFDSDGLLDVYVTNWANELGSGFPAFPGENHLYRNLGNFVFADVSVSARLDGLQRDSFTAIFHDFDFDHDPDLFIAVDHSSDEFFINEGNSAFTSATNSATTTHIGNDMGAACADFDDDGDLDIYSTNITDPTGPYGNGEHNTFYVNQWDSEGSIRFVDLATNHGVEDSFWGWGTDFTDPDNDGDLDLVAATGFDEFVITYDNDSDIYQTPSIFFENDGSGQFTRQIPTGLEGTFDSRALLTFDYDRDGDEDILLTNVNQSTVLLQNDTSPQGNWFGVRLIQSAGLNRNGIGATVYATLGSVTKRRDIMAGKSYLTGNPAEVFFGLGSASQIDTLKVVWTNGAETTYSNVVGNRIVTLQQDHQDADADGADDVTGDCATGDATLWSAPGMVTTLRLAKAGSTVDLTWNDPIEAGALTHRYDLIRSTSSQAWAASTCLLNDSLAESASDAVLPGQMFSYLVRARTACGSSVGSGTSLARTVPSCP